MMGVPRPLGKDPRRYTTPIRGKLEELANEMRNGANSVDDDKAKALLETSAEVIAGVKKAFEDFELKNEAAWR